VSEDSSSHDQGSASAYAQAGVDIAAGGRATELMKAAVQATHGSEVLAGIGAFGGLFDAQALQQMAHPVLVASTDGVGTKTRVASRLGRWETIGQDLVNHCLNDIAVQGARPLFFLDYVASSRLQPEIMAEIVGSMAQACRAAGCALLGGETAEMPGVYRPGEIDVVGTIVGVVERAEIIDGSAIRPGDAIIGLPSSGLHTNGYSLARRVLDDLDWTTPHPDLGASGSNRGATIGDALLAVHRAYRPAVDRLQAAGVALHGLAHITGGGLIDNPPRIFPPGLAVVIDRGSWPEPPIFGLIQRLGGIATAEMFHVFNMGLGMLAVVPAEQVPLALETLPGEAYRVGRIVAGPGTVTIQES
jgi:phosphoribosylformylglycinamidine cyclo-ligase